MKRFQKLLFATALILVIFALRTNAAAGGRAPQQTLGVVAGTVTVAPNQPTVQPGSTVGIINALCEVNLNFLGCGFMPTAISLACDTNGDGLPELTLPLKDITAVNAYVIRGQLGTLAPQLPGTVFPLACCGGVAGVTLTRKLQESPDNVFGNVTLTANCVIDVGLRAPVVISASPSDGDCGILQNLIIPGSCFLQLNGNPNVTSIFAVERDNPANVIQARDFTIINNNVIDAHFNFGAANAGKTFLIFAGGPNGTSRNLTALPAGAPAGCPLGNEQGIQVSFTCRAGSAATGQQPRVELPSISACQLERSGSGRFSLVLESNGIKEGSTIRIGETTAKKVKLKNRNASGLFTRVIVKGNVCAALPGPITVTDPEGRANAPFQCSAGCSN